jgi:signal transduction histidine kinase
VTLDLDSGAVRSNSGSGWDRTQESGPSDMLPGLSPRGVPVRLAAERDVMAVLTAVFVVAAGLSVTSTVATWDGRSAAGPWPLFALVVPHVLVLVAVLIAAYLALPGPRWLAPEELARRGRPLALRLARVVGFPSLLVAPLLDARDRREHGRLIAREEAEVAQLALLALPRAAAGLVAAGLIAVAASDALIAGHQLLWSWETTVVHLGLWLAFCGPLTVLAAAGVRLAVRSDVLATPQALVPLGAPPGMGRGLRLAAALTLGPAAVAPLLIAHLWLQAETRAHALRTAERSARALVAAAAPGQEAELGRLLAETPGASVTTAKGGAYGHYRSLPPETSGPIDTDLDGEIDFIGVVDGEAAAAVAVARPPPPPLVLLGVVAGLVLACGGLAVQLLIGERERDLARVRARITTNGDAALAAPTTPEWTALARAVDGLIVRMQEATIARFVALEKAEETDRLRSQFLANMSHDLRSPLNSILGFSSLLLRGVDGTLDAEQREMIETIASAGKDLLQQIDGILDMARIEARRIELQAEAVPLAPMISRAVQKARARGSEHIAYSIETVPGLPTAFVDPRHIVQALENLLLFAGKRMGAGTIAVKLRPGDLDSPLGLQIHITTPTKPATLQQLDLARRGFHRLPGHRGLGLELPIADALLRIEGSRLDVKEVGAMLFKIHLPAAESRHKLAVLERGRQPADSQA